jgi:phage tail-like protein
VEKQVNLAAAGSLPNRFTTHPPIAFYTQYTERANNQEKKMGSRNDPYGNFNFIVEIDGLGAAGFAEVSGLTTESDVIEYRNGNEDITVRKLPGLKKYTNITLKRGFTQNKELWEWRKQVLDGQTQRRNGSIIVLDKARNEVLRFTFREAWPVRWDGPDLDAQGKGVAIETLVIAHEGLFQP